MLDFLKGKVTSQDLMIVGAILGVTLVLVAGFYLLVYQKQQAEAADLSRQNKELLSKLDFARRKAQNFEELQVETQKINRLVSEFSERLPTDEELPRLATDLQAIQHEIGLRVKIQNMPRDRDPNKVTLRYSVEARGSFHQIASFINRLERYKRFLKVTDLKIGPEDEGISEASFTLSTYRFLSDNRTGEAS